MKFTGIAILELKAKIIFTSRRLSFGRGIE